MHYLVRSQSAALRSSGADEAEPASPALSAAGGSATETAYLMLHDDIVSCRLKPGTRVRIADLCARLGTNLSAVREALARLLADGLVVSEPQKGFQVAPVSTKDLSDLAFARVEIDQLCLHAALANRSIEWESGLVATLHRIRRTPVHADPDHTKVNPEFLRAAQQYYESLFSSSRNEWLLRLRRQLYTQFERYRRLTMIGFPNRDVCKEFVELTDAAISGDVALASALLRKSTTPSEELLNRLLTKVDIATGAVNPALQRRRKAAPGTRKKRPKSKD